MQFPNGVEIIWQAQSLPPIAGAMSKWHPLWVPAWAPLNAIYPFPINCRCPISIPCPLGAISLANWIPRLAKVMTESPISIVVCIPA